MNNHINKDRYGKVAVLYGGTSPEREVSLNTGQAVYDALIKQGIDTELIDAKEDLVAQLYQKGFSRVFNALHGGIGEDGALQGFLEILGLPYTGCDLLACAVTMDKLTCKAVWQAHGLPVLPAKIITDADKPSEIIKTLKLPIAIKPVNTGSSVGVSKVTHADDFIPAYELAKKYHHTVMAEPWVNGKELTIPVFNQRAFSIIEIKTEREFYDYTAKYIDNATQYICPCEDLTQELTEQLTAIALKAYQTSNCRGVVRVDFRLDEAQKPWLFEINTMPGLTERSLVPKSMAVSGIDFAQLVLLMLDETL